MDPSTAHGHSSLHDVEPRGLLLTRTDPARNLARLYVLSVEPALLAGAAILRQWGRIGTRGRNRFETLANEVDEALMRLAATNTRRGSRSVASS